MLFLDTLSPKFNCFESHTLIICFIFTTVIRFYNFCLLFRYDIILKLVMIYIIILLFVIFTVGKPRFFYAIDITIAFYQNLFIICHFRYFIYLYNWILL